MLEADVLQFYQTHQIEGPRWAVTTAAVSALCYAGLFLVLQSRLLTPVYAKLGRSSATARADLNQRLLEVLASLVTTASGIYAFCVSDFEDVNWLFGYSPSAEFIASAFIGYLVFDIGFNIVYRDTLWDTVDLIHHSIYIFVSVSYLYFGCLYKIQAVWLAVQECVVPFLHYRWWLASTNQRHTRRYAYNTIALFVAMTITRVVIFSMGVANAWHLLWNVYTAHAIPVNHLMHQAALAVCCLGFVLNLYWYLGVCKALRRVVGRLVHRQRPVTEPQAPMQPMLVSASKAKPVTRKQYRAVLGKENIRPRVVNLTAVGRAFACHAASAAKS